MLASCPTARQLVPYPWQLRILRKIAQQTAVNASLFDTGGESCSPEGSAKRDYRTLISSSSSTQNGRFARVRIFCLLIQALEDRHPPVAQSSVPLVLLVARCMHMQWRFLVHHHFTAAAESFVAEECMGAVVDDLVNVALERASMPPPVLDFGWI